MGRVCAIYVDLELIMKENRPASLKKNAFVNVLRVFLNLIFPLLTFPYASRILGPTGIGKIEFVQSIVSYFIIFSSFGIPLYGIREIGRHQSDKVARDTAFSEIFTIHTFFTTFVYVLYIVMIMFVPLFRTDRWLFFIFSSYIVLNLIGADWYFQGTERYSYITISSIAIKIVSLVILFGFVKTGADLLQYSLYVISLSVGSNILNSILVIREVRFKLPRFSAMRRHIRPIVSIFILNFIGSIYLNLDKAMIGFISGDFEVGIYAAANKVVYMVIALVTSINSVLLPRVSLYLESGQNERYKEVISMYFSVLVIILLPAAFGLGYIAPDLITILSGEAFGNAINVLRILALLVVFIGFSHFTGVVVLYPQKKEAVMMVSFLIAAALNFSTNLILIPRLGALGASIATILAEGSVVTFQIAYCIKVFRLRPSVIKAVIAFFSSVAMIALLSFVRSLLVDINGVLLLLILITAGVLFYSIISALFFRDEISWLLGRKIKLI